LLVNAPDILGRFTAITKEPMFPRGIEQLSGRGESALRLLFSGKAKLTVKIL